MDISAERGAALRELLKVRGKDGQLLPFRGLEHFGLSIQKIKEWREQEFNAGRANGLGDFYDVHGLCFDCLSTGVKEVGFSMPTEADLERIPGRDSQEELPFYVICSTCNGIGKSDRSKWQKRPRQ